MTDYTVIYLNNDDLNEWIVVDDQGGRKSAISRGSLGQAAIEAAGKPVIAIVPASETLTITTDLPAKGNRLLAALPFALEDQVADDIETLHFAPGKRLENGDLPVAVVSIAKLDAWLERLDSAGLRPEKIVPADGGIAAVPNTLSMLVTDDEILFNDGRGLQFTMPGSKPSDVLATAGYLGPDDDEDLDVPRALVVYCLPSAEEKFSTDFAALRVELDSVDVNLLPDGALPRLAAVIASGKGINLLQGAYGERADYSSFIKPWKAAAILLLSLGIVGIGGKAADYFRLGAEEAALKAQFTAEYRKVRPTDNREILDPQATVRSLLRQFDPGAAADPVFLPSLQFIAVALQANSAAEIQGVSYRAGVIDIRLTAPDVATLDRIQKSIQGSNRFTATIQSTEQRAERVNSRIQVREAGA